MSLTVFGEFQIAKGWEPLSKRVKKKVCVLWFRTAKGWEPLFKKESPWISQKCAFTCHVYPNPDEHVNPAKNAGTRKKIKESFFQHGTQFFSINKNKTKDGFTCTQYNAIKKLCVIWCKNFTYYLINWVYFQISKYILIWPILT